MNEAPTHTLEDVRRMLDRMAEWRLFEPLGDAQQRRYVRLCEYEERLLNRVR